MWKLNVRANRNNFFNFEEISGVNNNFSYKKVTFILNILKLCYFKDILIILIKVSC